MRPILFKIGDYPFYAYSVAMGLALLVSILLIVRQAKREGYDADRILEGCIIFATSGLFGARLVFVAQNWDYFRVNWPQIFTLKFGWFSVHGAIFLSLAAAFLWCRRRKTIKFLDLGDLMIPYYMVGYVIVRTLGCFLAGCCYGTVSAVPWAVVMHTVDSQPRHPVQIYAALGGVAMFIILKYFYRIRPFPGSNVLLMLALYGILRFSCEFFREADSEPLWLGLSLAQLASLLIIILSLSVMFAVLYSKRHRLAKQGSA